MDLAQTLLRQNGTRHLLSQISQTQIGIRTSPLVMTAVSIDDYYLLSLVVAERTALECIPRGNVGVVARRDAMLLELTEKSWGIK